jgi:peptide/nickel transport system ATP-binding protein
VSNALEVENLSVEFPSSRGTMYPVRDVSFTLRKGETLGIVGETGSGKSMSSLAIMNLLPKRAVRRATRLDFAGQSLLSLSQRKMSSLRGGRMGMIFQDPMTSLNPSYTIGNQMIEMLRRHREVTYAQARDRAVYLLERVGITAAAQRLGQYPHQLSGGLRQRVMIAMMLMCDPELVIADEPTTALDVTIQAQILALLAEIQKEFDISIILISHDLGVVARIADRIAVMYAGELMELAPAKDLFREPLHPYTEGLMHCIPMPVKTIPGSRLGAIPGIVQPQIGALTECSFLRRCPYAFEDCALAAIDLRAYSETHHYRCLLTPDQPRGRWKISGETEEKAQ